MLEHRDFITSMLKSLLCFLELLFDAVLHHISVFTSGRDAWSNITTVTITACGAKWCKPRIIIKCSWDGNWVSESWVPKAIRRYLFRDVNFLSRLAAHGCYLSIVIALLCTLVSFTRSRALQGRSYASIVI